MLIARVVGTLVSTQKHGALEGSKLLLVQPLSLGHEPLGAPVIAIDRSEAGVGDRVLLALDGKAAMQVLDRGLSPVDAAVLGVIDAVDLEGAPPSARPAR
jgi:microcompartment protein CcmK/EutM